MTPDHALRLRLEHFRWPHREHSRLVRRGGIAWHVQVMGAGPPLLLLHGTGASTHSFRELMPLLSTRFTVIAPDLPGHAFSTPPPGYVPSLPASAAALEELLEALGHAPRVVVGHSAGAAILAQMVLDEALEPDLLVGLAAAIVPFRGPARGVLLPAARLLARSRLASHLLAFQARDRSNVERVLVGTGSSLDAQGRALYQALSRQPAHVSGVLTMLANWDLEPLHAALPRVRVPVLLLAGARDLAVPLEQQRALVSRFPQARLEVLPEAGHLLHEEAPAHVAASILAALDKPSACDP